MWENDVDIDIIIKWFREWKRLEAEGNEHAFHFSLMNTEVIWRKCFKRCEICCLLKECLICPFDNSYVVCEECRNKNFRSLKYDIWKSRYDEKKDWI